MIWIISRQIFLSIAIWVRFRGPSASNRSEDLGDLKCGDGLNARKRFEQQPEAIAMRVEQRPGEVSS